MPSACQLADHRPQLAARDRIDADARLVEQQQPRACATSAQARPSFCFMPPDSLPASRSWKRARSVKSSRRSKVASRSARRQAAQLGIELEVLADASGLRRARSAAACSRSDRASSAGRRPSTRDLARVGAISPASMRISVVLPAPSGPTSPVICAGCDRDSNAVERGVAPPKRLTTPFAVATGSATPQFSAGGRAPVTVTRDRLALAKRAVGIGRR